MPEAKPAAKKAPKGKDAPKGTPPKEAPAEAPKEAPPEDQSPTVEEPTGIFLKKPDSVSVETGKDTVIVAKVNGKELPDKPTIKWFKGKWLELGSKSGARFSFKESHDSASNVYTVELHIGKVVLGDRGDYRLEVKAKDTCDSCGFNIDVEAPRQDASGQSLESFKRMGEGKSDTAGELDFSGLLKKREVVEEEKKKKKKDDDDLGIPPEIWELLKGAKKSEYEKIAFQYGITDLRGMLKRLKKAKVEVKKSAAFTKKLDPAYQVDRGNKIKLMVEISDPDLPLKWFKNGQEIKPSSKYVFENVGKKRILTINKCTLADDAAYEVAVKDEKCFTELFVKEPAVLIVTPLEDQQVFVGDRVEMAVEVSEEGAQVMWFHKLVIDDVRPEDEGDYTFVPDGYALSLSAKLNFLEIKVEYVPKQGEHHRLRWERVFTTTEGRIRIEKRADCSSFVIESAERADEGRYTIKVTNPVGEDVASIFLRVVDVPDPPEAVRITSVGEDWAILVWEPPKYDGGKPVTGYLLERKKKGSQRWMKLNFEVFTETTYESTKMIEGILYEMRVFAVNAIGVSQPSMNTKPFMPIAPTSEPLHLIVEDVTDTTTTLKWRPPNRIGAGGIDGYLVEYCLEGYTHLAVPSDKKAGPPINVMVKEVWGTNALVEWQAPKDDGNSEITGYFVQKADKKTMEWFNVYERNRHTSCTVSDLIVGNEYYFRVYTENICGLSDSPGVSKNTARILKTGITLKPFEYKEHDFRMAPKFLTPLIDRVVVAGYSAALNCAVRGHPKPKVVWMKNKMEIREDPKFLMTNYQGVLTLNIRRPAPFDAGTYTCLAVNELGEALAECKLEVRVPQ
ncbi:PREDICTED: myosin-binding protein C, fast-type [Colobus angolensis palliatus]|uniref:myosin-binding protein C, fast-type n=1 Tax=Colobus angolensis palliatus TaxID=336983 RepID=UPI0005F483B7|nr:PREDICTED: myosin-binding protein C, fast-type [Colobus angolensis palliatus]